MPATRARRLRRGQSRHHQVEQLRRGVEIVVATPLRLIDLIKSDEVDLGTVQIVVLDEADRMADDGFTPQVEWILRHCTGRTRRCCSRRRSTATSATSIRHYLSDPIEVAIDAATDTVGTMHHLFLAVHHMDKDKRRRGDRAGHPQDARVLPDQARLRPGGAQLAAISASTPRRSTATCPGARERALRRFAEGELAVLVATDVAARGIDIDDIGAVIHYEPAEGRARTTSTAPAAPPVPGSDGWAVTLVEYNQHTQMRILQRALRLPIGPPIEVFSNDARLHDLPLFGEDVIVDSTVPAAGSCDRRVTDMTVRSC